MLLSEFAPEFEMAGVKIMATTHQEGQEVASFVAGGFWKGPLYLDPNMETFGACGVTATSAWDTPRLLFRSIKGLTSGSKAFNEASKGVSGNLRGSKLTASSMVLISPEPASPPLFYQPFAEDPPLGKIFGALGADESSQHEYSARAQEQLRLVREGEHKQGKTVVEPVSCAAQSAGCGAVSHALVCDAING